MVIYYGNNIYIALDQQAGLNHRAELFTLVPRQMGGEFIGKD